MDQGMDESRPGGVGGRAEPLTGQAGEEACQGGVQHGGVCGAGHCLQRAADLLLSLCCVRPTPLTAHAAVAVRARPPALGLLAMRCSNYLAWGMAWDKLQNRTSVLVNGSGRCWRCQSSKRCVPGCCWCAWVSSPACSQDVDMLLNE